MTQPQTWLAHLGWAALISFLFAFQIGPIGAFFVAAAFFLGRERRDREIAIGTTDWRKGWNILKWSTDNRNDLLAVVAGGLTGASAHYFGVI